jgi:hypothetical protein
MGGFLHKLNKPKTLVVVLALTLVVDSFLLYRYRLIEPRRAPRRSTGLDRTDNRPLGEHGAREHNTAFAPNRKNAAFPGSLSSQAQCMDGGFVAFGFENQDKCTSFVAARGKDVPGSKKPVK